MTLVDQCVFSSKLLRLMLRTQEPPSQTQERMTKVTKEYIPGGSAYDQQAVPQPSAMAFGPTLANVALLLRGHHYHNILKSGCTCRGPPPTLAAKQNAKEKTSKHTKQESKSTKFKY